MNPLYVILAVLAGVALGALGMWLLQRGRAGAAASDARAAWEPQIATLNERLAAREKQIAELQAQLLARDASVSALRQELTGLKEERSRLETTVKKERESAAEKLALLNEAQAKLSDAFRALSAEALKSNNQSFMDLAKASLEKFTEAAKGDLEKRQQAIDRNHDAGEGHRWKNSMRKSSDLEKARVGAYGG